MTKQRAKEKQHFDNKTKTISGWLLFFGLFLLIATPTSAQFYFGKNKVQYTDFDWQVMETEHFRIYFYQEEAEIARIGAEAAEAAYEDLAVKFKHELSKKVPLVFYSSPGYFSQTNIIAGMLPESVAGFTEFLKGRVVVPFHGSYHDFNHVIWHEIVHVFTLSKLRVVSDRHRRSRNYLPPLWFTEGLAEYWSKDWDVEADMVVKDMILTNRFFNIENMFRIRGTYFMYKLGESLCHFIDSTYGPDKIIRLLENWPKGKRFESLIKITLGDSVKELSRKWEYYLKKKYYPTLADSDLPRMGSERITSDGYAVRGVPIHWDDGDGVQDWIVYKANVLGYSGIYIVPVDESEKPRILLKGERSSDFESLYLLRSGIDANDSGMIVFSSKSKESDVIYIYNLNREKVTERFEFKNLVAARSPRFSPDGRQVVFSGVKKSGFTDLYILNIVDGTYQTVTNDIYYDVDPVFSEDGKDLLFVSDRCAFGKKGASNIYRLHLASGLLTQLTFGDYDDHSPEVGPDGIYFSSDRGGSYNLFLLNKNGELSRQSTFATAALNPRLSSDGSRLLYTGYEGMRYQIYEMDVPEEAEPFEQPEVADGSHWLPKQIDEKFSSASIKYNSDYSLDIAQSAVGYDPVYGSLGGVQAAVSDVLGNRTFYFLVTNTAQTRDDFLESFNFGVTFINRENRINWGIGAFHLVDEYHNDFDGFYSERQAGGIGLLSYPFSKFHRIDLTVVGRYSKKDRVLLRTKREKFLLTNLVSLVYDNSLWDYSGPIEGRRYNFSVGYTVAGDADNVANSFNRVAVADVRHYYRLGMYSAFASRLFAYSSSGVEPQRIYFGGSWSFRGYDRRAFYNRNILFASHELRFPLIDNLFVGFPIGGLGFRGIRGAFFFDVGSAWDDEFDELLGSFGTGIRVGLAQVVVFRFDFSRTTDFETISPRTDFDFFFGWNF
ncbi:MAG: hypothetical protein P1R58_02180 [bacterium]|nr:hypothetical protein [bacterium]